MPAEIKARVQAAVRAENVSAASEGRAVQNPLRVTGSLPAGVNVQQRFNSKGGTREVTVQHQTSIHSDMIKTSRAIGGGRTSSTYNTIRRISEKSKPQAWWHPGFAGIRALKQVEVELRRKMAQLLKRELGSRGLGTK